MAIDDPIFGTRFNRQQFENQGFERNSDFFEKFATPLRSPTTGQTPRGTVFRNLRHRDDRPGGENFLARGSQAGTGSLPTLPSPQGSSSGGQGASGGPSFNFTMKGPLGDDGGPFGGPGPSPLKFLGGPANPGPLPSPNPAAQFLSQFLNGDNLDLRRVFQRMFGGR